MILDKIVARKEEEVALLRKNGVVLPKEFRDWEIPPPRQFRHALVSHSGVAIIAEAKKASPSKGVICHDFEITEIVKSFEENGAQAISVLTDVDFFQGSLTYLLQARQTMSLPVLRKDFIIDEQQIIEASLYGADAILLIAAILDEIQIQDYFLQAKELQMDVIVEVHDEKELEKVLRTDSDLIGINNRNLNDFTVDINTTFRLKEIVGDSLPVVSESGLRSVEDMKKLRRESIDAALIGETLMRAGTDGDILRELQLL